MLQEYDFPYTCDGYSNNINFYICLLFWQSDYRRHYRRIFIFILSIERRRFRNDFVHRPPKEARAHRTPEGTGLPVLGDYKSQIAQGTSDFKYPVPTSPYVPSYFLEQPGGAPGDMDPSLSVVIHLPIWQV